MPRDRRPLLTMCGARDLHFDDCQHEGGSQSERKMEYAMHMGPYSLLAIGHKPSEWTTIVPGGIGDTT